ncbi:flagellar hook-length control protein FliK [Sulfitobacter mediterraneus]|uniref:Flagellar hook-length control protein FliK n=1 Tax=Sulfitobacter mediterraneus TaxID=83219 RepID=A0A2T6CA37_9RHOB|nr:flagellar hook-length control protein FliK [Sulfitobacter mediterraneus]KIN77167.1 RNA polymerase sigma factor [Sulfitobacter mediterraneus KCTC 32188]PTX65146.1 flagellar hook-length control protein FliK [Sulfitobacter mediterraneus]
MLNLIFPTNAPANGASSTPSGTATSALPAGFGVMVETATGSATVDAAALVTGAMNTSVKAGQTAVPMPFLASGLPAPETLIPDGALATDVQIPVTDVALLGRAPTGTAAKQPVLAGQIAPETGSKSGVTELAANSAQNLAETNADHSVVAEVVSEPLDVQISKPVFVQTQTSLDATSQTSPQKIQVTTPTSGPQPHLATQPATAQTASPAIAAPPTATATQPNANLIATAQTASQDVAPTVAGQAAPNAQMPKAHISAAQLASTPKQPTAAGPVAQASEGQTTVIKANLPPVESTASSDLDRTFVKNQTVEAKSEATLKTIQTPVPAQATSTAAARKSVSSADTPQPVQVGPSATETTTKALASSAPLTVIATSTGPNPRQSDAQPAQAAPVAQANAPAHATLLRSVETAVTQPVQSDETQIAVKQPLAPDQVSEIVPKLAVTTPAANEGTQTSIATKVTELVVKNPATAPEPKLAAGVAPSPAVAPTTTEEVQTGTAPEAADKVTKSPATPAPITTIQAVTAQRNLVKPLQAANTGKPTTVETEAGQPRADMQQSVFETPTGQQSVVQIKAETAIAPALGPLGATPEALDPLLTPRADAAPVQGFDPATAAKVAAPQEAAPKAPPKPFAEALISQVKSVEVSEGRTSVSLHPRGLGNIEIEVVTEKDTAAKVVVRVENPAVLQSLRDERDLLAQAIGLSDSSIFEFHDHQPNDPSGGQGGQSQSSGQSGETSVTAETAPQHTDVVGDGQLDILT